MPFLSLIGAYLGFRRHLLVVIIVSISDEGYGQAVVIYCDYFIKVITEMVPKAHHSQYIIIASLYSWFNNYESFHPKVTRCITCSIFLLIKHNLENCSHVSFLKVFLEFELPVILRLF